MRKISSQVSTGHKIKEAILRHGKSQVEVANAANMRPQHLSDIILNKKNPAKTTLRRIARALDLPDDYFIQSDDRPKPSPESVRKRLVFEFYLPDGLDLTTEETVMLRKQVEQSVHNIFNWLKDLKKK